ncbi:MAG: response regulator [Methanoregula sp.]|nr:response regulator [Methanoregula sp.]MDD5024059.1 response regulator [Methanoregula sp.]
MTAFIQESAVKTESILIVEDDFIVAKLIEKSLVDIGYFVTGLVATGEEAIVKSETEHPDLVLMDINLKGKMDGIAASGKIHATLNIPVIFLTAFSDQKTFERALATAPYGYIIKPFSLSTLSTTIEMALYKHTLDRKLKESEANYRAIIENMQDTFYRMDLEGTITMISPSGINLVGCTSIEELIGKKFTHVLTNEQKDFTQLLQVLEKKGSVDQYPLILKDQQGLVHHVTASSHYYYDAKGEIQGVEGILHDITDRKKAEDALRRANRQLNLLTGITRHDILNKVTIILGYLGIAQKKSTDPALGEYFSKMESATKAIRSQIEFTRVYQDLGTNEPQWQVLDTIQPRSHVPPDITFTADVNGILVYADPMLEKVFFNLLDNSVRHGQRVTEIRVSSRQSGTSLVIVWEDNGVGIPPDEKEKIFERGFGKNTGLGLFLVREILAISGITIRETGIDGQGARFEILVPAGEYRFNRA